MDRMPVDLTTYNSLENDREDVNNGPAVRFQSRERGEDNEIENQRNNLWRAEPENRRAPAPAPELDTASIFPHKLAHSLGYMNRPYGQPYASADDYQGGPSGQPFPWLTWLNRPFSSPMELLMVPRSAPYELTVAYGMAYGQRNRELPLPQIPPWIHLGNPYRDYYSEFSHLPNYFRTKNGVNGTGGDSPFHRFLSLVRVPSRFVDSQIYGDPRSLDDADGIPPNPVPYMRPPFITIPTYREPGKPNLNLIVDRFVWNCMANGDSGLANDGTWQRFIRSRRGYGLTANITEPGNRASYFGRPFRSFAGAKLSIPEEGQQVLDENDVTLLRPDPSQQSKGLFVRDDPLLKRAHDDFDRNPYFRYQSLSRLSNLTTTQSNVYAIWITVGYFEIDPETGTLGQEVGSDTGDTRRHRAFYIVDRSIPVACQPGELNNVQRAILVSRLIE
jgi:hypothetical protein